MSGPVTNPTEGILEQSVVEKLEEALAALQAAQALFTDTMAALASHDANEESHLDIRHEIMAITVGTGFITSEQATQQIDSTLDIHNASVSAHANILTAIDGLLTRLAALEARVDAIEPIDEDDDLTELERRLKAIDDYYDPTLASLLNAWQVASMAGLSTADAIANEYQALLNEKAQARADVLREFDYA